MKRSLRRAVSLLCVLAMCIGLLPSTALAAGRPGGGGNYGGGGQETQQTVYVYIKIVDSNGQELTGSTVEIDGITYTVNEKGWYTLVRFSWTFQARAITIMETIKQSLPVIMPAT